MPGKGGHTEKKTVRELKVFAFEPGMVLEYIRGDKEEGWLL